MVAAFNLDKDENTVLGTVSPSDAEGLKKGTYLMYDWFNETARLVEYDEKLTLSLENYDDFRLLLFIPVKNGRAVIGLKEKYMAPATVKHIKGGVEALDEGTLLIWSQGALESRKVKKGEKVLF